jgi:hypothetical protein
MGSFLTKNEKIVLAQKYNQEGIGKKDAMERVKKMKKYIHTKTIQSNRENKTKRLSKEQMLNELFYS